MRQRSSSLSILRRVGRALVLVVMACALSCTHHRPLPPDLSGVYGRIHQSWEDYAAGIRLMLSGDEMAGQNLLAAATTRLEVVARECSQTPGCDSELFTDAMEQLVAEQRFAAQNPMTDDLVATLAVEPVAYDDAEDPAADFDGLASPATESLLTGAGLDDLIPMNRRVRAALNDWLTWHRPALMEAYDNYQFLRPGVAPVYEEAALPEALLFGIMVKESGAKVHAYSRSGAAGPLQFMRRTALRYGLGSTDGFDTRLDPKASTKANARFMKDLLRKFDGRLEMALAAYNMGETRLRRLHRRHPGADFWDPGVYYSLPWETRNYVPSVLAAALLFMHPDEYGLEFPDSEWTSSTIALAQDASLGELTVCLGQAGNHDGWFRTLRNLNPRLSPGERSAAGTNVNLPVRLVPVYNERCIGDDPLVQLAQGLHDADYPEKPEVMHYTVRPGDTLAEIATRHRCSLRELAAMNGIRDPEYVIRVGQQLTVPTRG